MREAIARLTQEKGQAEEMVGLLNRKLEEYNEELFDAKSNLAMIEAEATYKCQQNELATAQKVASLTSQVAFLREQIATADRAQSRLRKELEQAHTVKLVEQKRLAAERKLLETKKRHLELSSQASQSLAPSQSFAPSQRTVFPSQQPAAPSQSLSRLRPISPLPPCLPPVATTSTAIQTDAVTSLSHENAELVHGLLQGSALLTLLNHSSSPAADGPDEPPRPEPAPRDTEFSQLMQPFSQWFPPPPSPTVAKMAPIALAQQLYGMLSQLLAGETSSVHLIPLLTDYLLADVECSVLTSSLQVLLGLLHGSPRVQAALRDRPTTPRVRRVVVGSRPVDGPATAVSVGDLEVAAVRSKCAHALTRVLKHHVHQPPVLEFALAVVLLWTQLSRQGAEALLPVLQDILSSPKTTSNVQVQALALLTQLLQTDELFQIWRRQKLLLPLVLLKTPAKLTALHVSVQLALLRFVDFVIMTHGLAGATCILSHQPDEASVVQPIVKLMETAIAVLDDASAVDVDVHRQLIRTGFQLISALEQYVELRSQAREPKQKAALYFVLHYVQRELPRDAVTAMALMSVDYVAVTNEADPNGFAADAEAAVYYANIDKILDRFGCSTKYSLYNCDDCRDAYKYWVCAVKFQRCGGPSATATAVCPTIANSCDPFRTRTCLSICEDVIRKCPYVLSFNCPAEETEYFSTDIANCNHLDRAVHPDNPSLAWPGTFASS
ncbi:hypothetical protein ACHHYP_09407 [Achlya hypogyna]|uniref:Uncharacterized protein n=1 Tax=Achlya hypogyna TaxID=1202772 RepID=A0A1V9YN65_ACHHY|nr:hypothetical protein ACHHYP_09407 [Achlya hypogyna]